MCVFILQEVHTPKLINMGEVTTSFIAAMKFRRKTVGDLDTKLKESEMGTGFRKLSTVSGGPTVASNEPMKLPRATSFRGLSKGITTMLRLRRMTKDKGKDGVFLQRPRIRYENTYKIEPDNGTTFNVSKTHDVVYDVMENELRDKSYDYMTAGEITCQLSTRIKSKVKELELPRYRIVSQVVVAENKGEGIETASRFLWNDKTDNFTYVSYTNDSIAAIAVVYGIYLD